MCVCVCSTHSRHIQKQEDRVARHMGNQVGNSPDLHHKGQDHMDPVHLSSKIRNS